MEKPRIGAARRAARQILSDLKISSPPIKLSRVVQHLNYHVSGLDFDDGLSGIQVTFSEECFIAYNKNHHVHRKRFTVAHEIGHSVLGHTSHINQGRDLNSAEVDKIEADQFAAELLMPLRMVKADIEGGIRSANQLALRYWVSQEAMGRRLMETGLYKKLERW